MFTGYARCAAQGDDEREQRAALVELGVPADRIFVDHGLTGTDREREGLPAALAGLSTGDTLVVTKLERLAWSVADLSHTVTKLEDRGVKLSFDGETYDAADPIGRKVFAILGTTFAEFDSGLIRLRTSGGVAKAKAEGKYRGRVLKLSPEQQSELFDRHQSGKYKIAELQSMYDLSMKAVYNYVDRERPPAQRSRCCGS
ncbi:DNA invertase Pin-like site-specific DNA recombinase [Rhodococcus sp. PvR044]|jgi:DNA invertase Pin-like site-specific DNA recombinase|uniref:recombinase family protein n=1 Tax=unclassified Rhodococcus (in: high G+C Gram-positive bacteria) TaxID=192944 RepID=UPI000BD341C0|nr:MULTISPECIES: recombinase family protein [unclassified Rhodococcus (in: high G+C Gram-positive bacteria)]MBP1157963.1 DNA invertase Pin-like site-specific DNA recombinase [Rhodococcus sp. PvR099]PTR37800.1 DNA invertase Pin-like site-specific DNA recombinase [Rhodococcus sp. OK611]SNX93231.1 Site-specific DNA recombinase [Rhodococcus sp. OK270]